MKKLVFILILGSLFLNSKAQQIEYYANTLFGIRAGDQKQSGLNGSAYGVNFMKEIIPGFGWFAGVEFNSVSWGFNSMMNGGLSYQHVLGNRFYWQAHFAIQQGFTMTKPSVLYVTGGYATIGIGYALTKKSEIELSSGLKYYYCPVYKQYSLINSYLDCPLQLSWIHNINTK